MLILIISRFMSESRGCQHHYLTKCVVPDQPAVQHSDALATPGRRFTQHICLTVLRLQLDNMCVMHTRCTHAWAVLPLHQDNSACACSRPPRRRSL